MAIGTAAAIGLGLGGLSTLAGADAASKSQRAAGREAERAAALFAGLEMADLQEYSPEMLEFLGGLSPQQEEQIQLQESAFNSINADPRLQAEQMAALDQLSALSTSGLSEADLGGLELARRRAGASSQAQQQQILQSMQQRGLGGSGAELIARLQSAQSGSDRELDANLEIAQMAQQRALQAIQNRGTMATSMRTQDVGEQERVAQSRDAINQFQAQLDASRQNRNVDRTNQADMFDVTSRQNIANQNVGTRNAAQLTERERQQQLFANRLAKTQGQAGQSANLQNSLNNQASTQAQLGATIGKGFLDTGLAILPSSTSAATPVPKPKDPLEGR